MTHATSVVTLADALSGLPLPPTARWPDGVFDRQLLARHDVSVEIFAPEGRDHQQPHARDELYLVARGTATLVADDVRRTVRAGDLIFVPAGAEHRFHDIADGFATWVVFFGPSQVSGTEATA